jgi:chemotaxis signal transduction protein
MTATSATPARRTPTGKRRTAVYALVRAHGRTIAIPGESVTQAVEAPAELAQVPRRDSAVEGVITLDRRVLPVVGLSRWLSPQAGLDGPPAATARPRGLVLLLRSGQSRVGLAIEAVVGVQRIAADQVRRLFHDDDPKELFQSVALFGDDPAPTSILEPSRLIALAGVWDAEAAVDDSPSGSETALLGAAASSASQDAVGGSGPHDAAASSARQESAASPTTSRGESFATFRIADVHFALPASDIGELLRRPVLREELLPHDGVLGLCEWRGRVVPVVDLSGALQALPCADAATWLCIVCHGDLAIGIVMHEVLDLVRIAADAGTPEHAPHSQRSVVERRLVIGERLLQVIAVTALMRRYTETALSANGAAQVRLRDTADTISPAYMVFHAGGPFAAPIDGVQEVVAMPDELRSRLDAGIATTLHWREQPVPVMAIADSLVTMPVGAARQLIVVRQGERLAALAIDGVKGLVPRGAAVCNRMRLRGRAVDIVSVDTEDHRASYAVVDLQAALALPA